MLVLPSGGVNRGVGRVALGGSFAERRLRQVESLVRQTAENPVWPVTLFSRYARFASSGGSRPAHYSFGQRMAYLPVKSCIQRRLLGSSATIDVGPCELRLEPQHLHTERISNLRQSLHVA
jgi:hypothetical protein